MDFEAKSFTELHEVLRPFRENKLHVFRGHADSRWELLPRAGRAEFRRVDDRIVFAAWKRRAIEFVGTPPADDWEWLTVAQHHGLATRLLDWTINPLIAAYFAVAQEADADAVIYSARFSRRAHPSVISSPMKETTVSLYYPAGVVPRITRQGGLFSVHPTPQDPLTESSDAFASFDRTILPREYRSQMRSELSYYGFNSSSLFPDLDGLSTFVNWTVSSGEYWNVITDPVPTDGAPDKIAAEHVIPPPMGC